MDDNKYYRLLRLSVICLFCNDKHVEEYGVDRLEFDKTMRWLQDIYMDAIKYREDK